MLLCCFSPCGRSQDLCRQGLYLSCSQPLSSAPRTMYLLKEHKILLCYGGHQGPILSLLCSFCLSKSTLLFVSDPVAWKIKIWHCVNWASSHSEFYWGLDNRGAGMKLRRRGVRSGYLSPTVSWGRVTTGCFFPLTNSLSPFQTALTVSESCSSSFPFRI